MRYQDLSLAKELVVRMYVRNPNRSISTTFRTLRKKKYLSTIGDYPILSTIISIMAVSNISTTRNKIWYAFDKSDELKILSKKEKIDLLTQLVLLSINQINLSHNSKFLEKNKKFDSESLQSKLS